MMRAKVLQQGDGVASLMRTLILAVVVISHFSLLLLVLQYLSIAQFVVAHFSCRIGIRHSFSQ
jgi:hypothetical protein